MRYIELIIVMGIILILGGCGTAGKKFNTSKIVVYSSDCSGTS